MRACTTPREPRIRKIRWVPAYPNLSRRIDDFRSRAESARGELRKELTGTSDRIMGAYTKLSGAYPPSKDASCRVVCHNEPLSMNVSSPGEMHNNLEILHKRYLRTEEFKDRVALWSGRLIAYIPPEPTRPESWLGTGLSGRGKFIFAGISAVMDLMVSTIYYVENSLGRPGQFDLSAFREALAMGTGGMLVAIVGGFSLAILLTKSGLRSEARAAEARLNRLEASLLELRKKVSSTVKTCTDGVDELLSELARHTPS